MNLTISFPGAEQTTLTQVGGKGYSLIRMVEAGLPVPPGTVLTTEFFEPWFDEISEVVGVGFTINPLTNDYDEAVIDANWGLGDSVAAGLVSPDHFIVDKFSRQIIEKKLGPKQVSIWLGPDDGTIERKGYRSAELTLNDSQLNELTEVFCRIEALYDKPMDIEWTYGDGQLYVLQARPITRYVPLAAEMVTRPGERRRLYADAALSKGMTLNAPISPMGLSWMEDFMTSLFERIQLNAGPMEGLVFAAGGRMYMNLSNVMWLAKN